MILKDYLGAKMKSMHKILYYTVLQAFWRSSMDFKILLHKKFLSFNSISGIFEVSWYIFLLMSCLLFWIWFMENLFLAKWNFDLKTFAYKYWVYLILDVM